MAVRALVATFGFDERRVLPAMRLLPYDELVLLAGRDSVRASGFAHVRALEPSLRSVTVDPYDFAACFAAAGTTLRGLLRQGRAVRVSITGGTKILAGAVLLAAFHEGVEAWYCDPDPIRLPVLRGVRIAEGMSDAARDLADALRGPMPVDRLLATLGRHGRDRRAARAALRELETQGLAEQRLVDGHATVRPTNALALYRPHLPSRVARKA